MKRNAFTLIGVLTLMSCFILAFTKNQQSDNLKTIVYGIHYFLVNDETAEMVNQDDSVQVSYFKDLTCLRVEVPEYEMKIKDTQKLEMVIDDSKVLKMNYYYIIRKGNNKQSSFYTAGDNYKRGLQVNSDSVFSRYMFVFPVIVSPDEFQLIEAKKQGEMHFEKYVLKKKIDMSYPDTIKLIYDKSYSDIPFSFSREKDSSRASKLIGVYSTYRDTTIQHQNRHLPSRAINFYIRRETNARDTILNRILKDYKF